MANLQPGKWAAIFEGPFNSNTKLPVVAELVDTQGIRTTIISPPDTPPGKVLTKVWVPSDTARDVIDSKPQFDRQGEWIEVTPEL
jgi:hypothetical protein